METKVADFRVPHPSFNALYNADTLKCELGSTSHSVATCTISLICQEDMWICLLELPWQSSMGCWAYTTGTCCPMGLEAGSPRLRCCRAVSFWGPGGETLFQAPLLACEWPSFPESPHCLPFIYVCLHISCSSKDTSHVGLGPPKWPHYNDHVQRS